MAYYIHKQLIPIDRSMGDPNWSKRQIWVLKLNAEDTIDSFESIEEAQTKVGLLMNEDPSGRVYKIVQKNEDGTFSDI
jgi:hypothetical protein